MLGHGCWPVPIIQLPIWQKLVAVEVSRLSDSLSFELVNGLVRIRPSVHPERSRLAPVQLLADAPDDSLDEHEVSCLVLLVSRVLWEPAPHRFLRSFLHLLRDLVRPLESPSKPSGVLILALWLLLLFRLLQNLVQWEPRAVPEVELSRAISRGSAAVAVEHFLHYGQQFYPVQRFGPGEF